MHVAPSPTPADARAALSLLHQWVGDEIDACLIERDGHCHEHDGTVEPDEPDAACPVTKARELLDRLGYPLPLPAGPPLATDSDAVRRARPAVCMELSLTLRERATIRERVIVNNGYSHALQSFAVCTMLAAGLDHDDVLGWTEPLYDGPGELPAAVWEQWADTHLEAEADTRTWCSIAVLTAAYLHGRQPTPEEVLALAGRAATVGRARVGTDEARRLLRHYDSVAGHPVPGGMWTDSPPSVVPSG